MRKDIATECSSFSHIDDLTKEITELAGLVNARFIVDDEKIRGLKSLSRAASHHRSIRQPKGGKRIGP
jgi:hypothetical protein